MSRERGSAKTGGRVKGSKNKSSEEIKQALRMLMSNNLDQLQKDIAGMEGKDRAQLLISLAKHLTAPEINPEKLTDSQLFQVVEYLKKNEQERVKG